MANRVSVAVGESETTQCGVETLAAPSDALSSGYASALTKSATTKRSGLNMDISFPSKLVWTTDGYPNDRSLPRELSFTSPRRRRPGLWASHEGHLQLRDSVGISPTSLPRGTRDLISSVVASTLGARGSAALDLLTALKKRTSD